MIRANGLLMRPVLIPAPPARNGRWHSIPISVEYSILLKIGIWLRPTSGTMDHRTLVMDSDGVRFHRFLWVGISKTNRSLRTGVGLTRGNSGPAGARSVIRTSAGERI